MTDTGPLPTPRFPKLLTTACLGSAAIGVGLLFAVEALRRDVAAVRDMSERAQRELQAINGEITRFRIEQRSEGRGINALLEKLRAYAPELSSAQVAKPQYEFAKQEMASILRAMASLGPEAFGPIQLRFTSLRPQTDFDEMSWLLEAGLRVDPAAGKLLAQKVLQGYHKDVPTSPRLRWFAADQLLAIDRPLAGRLLREILSYESSRGINRERAGAYGVTASISAELSTGFENLVSRYVRSEDPNIDDTLIMMLGHAEHDLPTIQDCVKALGARKCAKADQDIERLYEHPPVISDNPIFRNICLEALAQIRGKAGIPWFEEKLKDAPNELLANKLRKILEQLRTPP
jgi:hypothetical protein